MGATLGELRAAMNRLKGKIRSQMESMEVNLLKDTFPKRSLVRKLGNAETDWNKVENYFTHILTLVEDGQAEDDRLAYEEFQTRYLTLKGRAEDALDGHQVEEEARERDRLKVSKVCQLGERWGVAYHHIETVLGELKTRVRGGTH